MKEKNYRKAYCCLYCSHYLEDSSDGKELFFICALTDLTIDREGVCDMFENKNQK